MNLAKNMRIKTKLTIAFITLSVISGIIGWVAMQNINKVSDNGKSMYELQTMPLAYLSEIVDKFPQIRIDIRNAILATTADNVEKSKSALNVKNMQIDSLLQILKKLDSDETISMEIISNIEINKIEFIKFANSICDISLTGDKIKALEEMQSVAAQVPTVNIVNGLEKLKRIEISQAKESAIENEKITENSNNMMLGFTAFGMIVALLFSYILSKMIVRPLLLAVNAANSIAKGELNVKLNSDSSDETGTLLQAMNQMAGSLTSLISDVKGLTLAAENGKLDVRADASKHSGAFNEIVTGINGTLDSVIRPLNVAAEYIDRISKGDIPPKIVDDYKGDFNEIKQNLNQCIDSMDTMISELNVTIEGHKAGDVEARCDASKLLGSYKLLMTGINDALDSIANPVIESIGIMHQYAAGDLSKPMRTLPGKQNTLTQAINNIRHNVLALIDDANMLSDAAIEGRLDFRASGTKHQGDFRRIIEGFNGTLDSVIRPLNVAAEYIDRISKGDIPPKILDDYKGDFNEIKLNINQCVDSLNLMNQFLQKNIDEQVAGDIVARIEPANLQGFYRSLLLGVNETMDVIHGAVAKGLYVMDKYAEGDLSIIMEDLPGKQMVLPNALNNIRRNILGLITDTKLLVDSAIAGKLDVRADATKHQGDFRKIIEGFNGTLDSVIGPLNVAAEYIDRISKGDIPPKIVDNYNGDFNEIKQNLNQCIEAIALLMQDATMLSSSAIAGDLTNRAKAENHQGDFRKLVIEMNQLMNAIAEPIEETSRILSEMSINNFEANYNKEFNGIWQTMREFTEAAQNRVKNAIRIAVNISNGDLSDYNDLKQIGKRSDNDKLVPTFAKLIETIHTMINIMVDNTNSQKAGDIDAYADSSLFSGEYIKLIDGYNDGLRLYNDIILSIVNLLDKYAAGDLHEEMPIMPGKQSILSDCINKLRLNVMDLITDSTMLAKSAVLGKLDTRADASKHKGDFRRIIEGVNNTLDAIIYPLNLSAEYMDRIAKGDIPPLITEEYHGDFNEIKNNLNLCIDSINLLVSDANGLAEAAIIGDIKKRADIEKHNGDYRKIIHGFNNTLDSIIAPIDEAVGILELMAQGDLSHLMDGDFKGDHAVLKQSLNGTLISINELLNQVAETVDQVLTGSGQVAEASQNLSSGASEQAAAIEQMSSSMMQIASQTKQNADNALNANKLADDSQTSSEHGFNEMQQLQTAMNDINESSKSIAKIIKVIDEIAFQTNLLALNAAVEAARAGVHGQGFAVVAEEVRNLARRSAEAAKETADLIEGSIKKVNIGTTLSGKTAVVLNEIREQSTIVAGIIRQIAVASNEQAEGINQIEIGFSQIDKVTQRNTAGAEQSASAAEELASQAQMLTEMLNNFELLNIQSNMNMQTSNRKALKAKDKRLKYSNESNYQQLDYANRAEKPTNNFWNTDNQ